MSPALRKCNICGREMAGVTALCNLVLLVIVMAGCAYVTYVAYTQRDLQPDDTKPRQESWQEIRNTYFDNVPIVIGVSAGAIFVNFVLWMLNLGKVIP